ERLCGLDLEDRPVSGEQIVQRHGESDVLDDRAAVRTAGRGFLHRCSPVFVDAVPPRRAYQADARRTRLAPRPWRGAVESGGEETEAGGVPGEQAEGVEAVGARWHAGE